MKRATLLATAAALLVTPALAGALQPAPLSGHAATAGLVHVAMSMSAQDYVRKTTQVNTAEIAAAKMAQEKAKSPAVKQFAAMMIKDHTAAGAKLKAIVEKEPGMALPKAMMSPKDAAMAKKLEAASGAEFDKMYIQGQIEGHTDALKVQQAYAKSGDNADLKMFAEQTSKIVAGHLQHAEMIAAKMGS
jgi:putative membrane protein